MKTTMRKKYSKKRAIFKNKSEKRDLQLIKVFSLKRSTESRYDDPATAKGYGSQLSSIISRINKTLLVISPLH